MDIYWDETYNIGIKEIDDQHQRLFEILQDLNLAMMKGRAKYHIQETLSQLADYTYYHFDFEEQIMEKFKYPRMGGHVEEHQRFRKELATQILKFNEGNTLVNVDTYMQIRDWILSHVTDHTQGYDQALGHFLRQKGLT